ncbi:MAG: DUF177 domain-containing protein [Bacteroides sp.]|nr:DUF177 domain-containing protein [Bacteroides sp.]MCM1413001.1 DUF177 domain-containing protein [Bacteroides sp.]MCM1471707.1 DUF177 domain-containing protein [Bacteroides sp.]
MGKFTEYKIPLMSMPAGVQTYEFHLGKQFFINMENPDIHDADLTCVLTVDHKGDLYQMDFAIRGTITLLCDRCLDTLEWPVDTTYSIAVKYGDDYNDESDNLLIIPHSDAYLNVAYMIHDTVALTIPIKHVHPLGKCNRQMSAVLKKHRAGDPNDEDIELEQELIDSIDNIEQDAQQSSAPTDPRWDALKGLASPSQGDPAE